jgi:hypothetical protein
MVHCGYEPTATLGLNAQPGDTWANLVFNFAPRPQPRPEGAQVQAFNGVSIGQGHKTGQVEKTVRVEAAVAPLPETTKSTDSCCV